MELIMSLLETLKKVEKFILGDEKQKNDRKHQDHWEKYRKPKLDSQS